MFDELLEFALERLPLEIEDAHHVGTVVVEKVGVVRDVDDQESTLASICFDHDKGLDVKVGKELASLRNQARADA